MILSFSLETVPSQESETNRISLDPNLSFVCLYGFIQPEAAMVSALLWTTFFVAMLQDGA